MLFIPVGVSDIVLHVSDDYILPVGDIEGTVGPENCIGWAEVLIPTEHKADRLLLHLGSIR